MSLSNCDQQLFFLLPLLILSKCQAKVIFQMDFYNNEKTIFYNFLRFKSICLFQTIKENHPTIDRNKNYKVKVFILKC